MFEYAGFIFGLIYIVTAGLHWRSSWYYGLISVLVYIYVFYTSQLYADLILQLFYVVATLYGIYMWRNPKLSHTGMNFREHMQFFGEGLMWSFLLYQTNIHLPKLSAYWFQTPSFPITDSIISGFSIGATRLIAHKKTPIWIWWVFIDLAGSGLYIAKDLWVTALLNLTYAGFAVWNYFLWNRSAATE